MSDLFGAMSISASGMKAQSARMRVISENMANADTAASTPGGDPYARQSLTFKNVMDKNMGIRKVEVDKVLSDRRTPFPVKYMPDHPAADGNGYVKMPNVETLLEAMDMREAQRSYEANLGMVEQSRNMVMQTIDILRR